MNLLSKFLSAALALCMVAGCFASCNPESTDTTADTNAAPETSGELGEIVDYVSQLKLDMTSSSLKIENVKVKQYIDGDTTHFYVPENVIDKGILKARYIAINTPESTGQIEEWGKKASNFTKTKLQAATSIILESDTDALNVDSTGDRHLIWVWYKTADSAEYRNLNLEILQEGLAIASSSSQNRYGSICMNAIDQAKAHKLFVYSDENDPDFYYGSAIELTLKELRANPALYTGKTVAFEGIVSKNSGQSIYVEAFDDETNMYHGITVYYGFTLTGAGLNVIKPGNKVRIVGSMQFYEAGGTYQVSDLKYDMMDTKNPNNIQKLGDGFEAAYVETSPETFATSKVAVTVIGDDGEETLKEVDYAELALSSTLSMKNLEVKDIYVTNNDGDSDGAMTLTCQAGGQTISVRTTVLLDEAGNLITRDYFEGKTIDVKGIVDYFNGKYQIKVFSVKDVTVH